MNKDKDLIREIPYFLGVYSLFLFAGMTLLAYFGKEELHLYFNQFYCTWSDLFFKYYTDIAIDGTLIFLLVYIFFKRTWFEMALLILPYALGSLLSTIVKKAFFIDVHRPTYYFSFRKIPLHLVEGVKSQIPFTFPSGHALNAFLFFALLSILYKNRTLQILFAFLAILESISRIYLSKHFMLDTIGGSFLGMMVFVFSYYFLTYKEFPFLTKKCNFLKNK
jgi:membrane-associated phospholipid phosphatase